MPEGLSMWAEKVYNAMKQAEITSEEKMANAERIVGLTKAPKNFVLRALDELQAKGLAKRKAREKAAGYYLIIKQ
jgi:Fic family protein